MEVIITKGQTEDIEVIAKFQVDMAMESESTAYIIWTGLGAIGTLLICILFFGDSASLLRMFFALLTLVGIVGLECTSK